MKKFLFLLILFTGCMKEEEVVLVTRTPLEGTYKGSMSEAE